MPSLLDPSSLTRIGRGRTLRVSSWARSGRNDDWWTLKPGETKVLADLKGPGRITHLWMTQYNHYRDVLIRISWDGARKPSVYVPLGDFFCLGHGIVNSFQSALFSASSNENNRINGGCALNCYAQMPFRKAAKIELINESREEHKQYFYVDYELGPVAPDEGYFHAEFRRANPFGGWGHEITVNKREADAVNLGRQAWENNYVIAEVVGRGHYIGCNLSVTNFQGTWWGEGDDMIWVDGFKWPPDLHGTGSEDYLNQAWGMQPNAFMRNGSSIHENNTKGYQTSYVFHLENPVRFNRSLKATIEHGHANHLANEMSSVGYWYADAPTAVVLPPPVAKRQIVLRDNKGKWLHDPRSRITPFKVNLTPEMKKLKAQWKRARR